jgi:hypothetical protein
MTRVMAMTKPFKSRPNNRADAVSLCEAGFAIFPLIPATKFPAISSPHPKDSPERGRCRGDCGHLGHGFYDARADAGWADRYWTDHPDHGISARPGPDQIVLDIDPRHGGDAALAALEARYGNLPKTLTVLSGRGDGGRHLWFSGVAGPVRSHLCTGVDVLSHSRGAAVMPPSLHGGTGLPYRFQTPVSDIVPAPSWLRDLVARPEPSGILPRPMRRISPSQARRRARGLLTAVADAPSGERHNTLYWATSRAVDDGLLDADGHLATALADAARDAGLDDYEIDDIITDAVAAADHPGGGW